VSVGVVSQMPPEGERRKTWPPQSYGAPRYKRFDAETEGMEASEQSQTDRAKKLRGVKPAPQRNLDGRMFPRAGNSLAYES
jgi:hypothetical protein